MSCTHLSYASLQSLLQKAGGGLDETFTYLDKESASQAVLVLSDLQVCVGTGYYDGVLAFSEGAALAALLLIQHSQSASRSPRGPATTVADTASPSCPSPFPVAIFFSGGIPVCPTTLAPAANSPGSVHHTGLSCRLMSFSQDGIQIRIPIRIPTCHIWGGNDTQYPNFGPVRFEMYDPSTRNRCIHSARHVVVPSPAEVRSEGKGKNSNHGGEDNDGDDELIGIKKIIRRISMQAEDA